MAQQLFHIDVVRPTGKSLAGKIVSSWITYADSVEAAEGKFNKMVEDDFRNGGTDTWHPRPGDHLSVEPVEFETPCVQIG